MSVTEQTPSLYLSLPYPCSYLPEQRATTLFIDPHHRVSRALFDEYTRRGFRRSGDLVYRPHCQHCQACVSVRVAARRFRPNRSQRRVWRRNQDLVVVEREAGFQREHFELYLRYQAGRHPGSSMNNPSPGLYADFLLSEFADTRFVEFRRPDGGRRLLAVAVMDRLSDGLSAVYTFYDPRARRRGLGTFAILWEIDAARRAGLDWVYLGYWIAGCDKMDYKVRFRPLERYRDGRWTPLPEAAGRD